MATEPVTREELAEAATGVKQFSIKVCCSTCASYRIERGPRTESHPSGDIPYCFRTDEIDPKSVCFRWNPSREWFRRQLWQEEQRALSRLDAEQEEVVTGEACQYCLRPISDCDCCDADVKPDMGDSNG